MNLEWGGSGLKDVSESLDEVFVMKVHTIDL